MSSLGPVIGRLSVAVKRGDSFAAAVAREPQAFDALFVGMMRVAEARGGIPETLKSLSRHYENRQSLIRQARSAMIYPLAVLLIASAVVAMMTLWLLPKFTRPLGRASRGTRARSNLADADADGFQQFRSRHRLVHHSVRHDRHTAAPDCLLQVGRGKTGDGNRIAMLTPVFGTDSSRKLTDTTRFTRTLSTLLPDAGVDIYRIRRARADRRRRAARPIATRRDEHAFAGHPGGRAEHGHGQDAELRPDVIAVVNSGEETGKLPGKASTTWRTIMKSRSNTWSGTWDSSFSRSYDGFMGGLVLFIILARVPPLPEHDLQPDQAGGIRRVRPPRGRSREPGALRARPFSRRPQPPQDGRDEKHEERRHEAEHRRRLKRCPAKHRHERQRRSQ